MPLLVLAAPGLSGSLLASILDNTRYIRISIFVLEPTPKAMQLEKRILTTDSSGRHPLGCGLRVLVVP